MLRKRKRLTINDLIEIQHLAYIWGRNKQRTRLMMFNRQKILSTILMCSLILIVGGCARVISGQKEMTQKSDTKATKITETLPPLDASFFENCAFISVDLQPLQRNYMTLETMPKAWREAGWKPEDFNKATDFKFDVAFPNARKVADACRSIDLPMIFVHWGYRFRNGMDLAPGIREFNIKTHGPDYTKWANHISDPGARPAEFLAVREGEYIIAKTDHDAFTSSSIDFVLKNLGIKNIVFIGGHTDACLGKTSISAKERGYQTLCVEDATFAGMMSLWRQGLNDSRYDYIIKTSEFIKLVESIHATDSLQGRKNDTFIPPDSPLALPVYKEQAFGVARPGAVEFWPTSPEHNGYPWNIIRMWFPEAGKILNDKGQEILNIHMSRDPATWEYVENGLRAECDVPGGGKFIRTIERQGPVLNLTMTFQNDSDTDWSHAEAGSCLQMSAAFDYEDNSGERTYWFIDNKLTATCRTAITDPGMRGLCAIGEAIPMKDGTKKKVTEGAVFIVSKDGKYVLGYSWQLPIGLFYNRAGIVACVHVQPQAIKVSAGESRSVKGIIFLHEGSLEEAGQKYLEWENASDTPRSH